MWMGLLFTSRLVATTKVISFLKRIPSRNALKWRMLQKCGCVRVPSDGICVISGVPAIRDDHLKNAISFACDLQALIKFVFLFLVVTIGRSQECCELPEGWGWGKGGGRKWSSLTPNSNPSSVDIFWQFRTTALNTLSPLSWLGVTSDMI